MAIIRRDTTPAVILQKLDLAPAVLLQNLSPPPQLLQFLGQCCLHYCCIPMVTAVLLSSPSLCSPIVWVSVLVQLIAGMKWPVRCQVDH